MFFNKAICESLKNVALENNAKETYAAFYSLNIGSNAKRPKNLKKVQDIDSANSEDYAIAMQDIQKGLKDIDLKAKHYETGPPAHMNRLLENLGDEQTKKIKYCCMEK